MGLEVYDIAYPANFDEFLVQVKDVIEFKFLSLEYIIQQFNPFFNIGDLFGLSAARIEGSILGAIGPIFTALLMFSAVLLVIVLIYLAAKPLRPKIREIAQKQKEKFIFSGLIRMQTIEYIVFLTPMVGQLKRLMNNEQVGRTRMIFELSVLVPLLVVFPIFLIYFLNKNRYKILKGDKEFCKKYDFLLAGARV